MVSKPSDMQLPESVPNPSFEPLLDEYSVSGNGSSDGNNSCIAGSNLKLRAPMERRYVLSTVVILLVTDDDHKILCADDRS